MAARLPVAFSLFLITFCTLSGASRTAEPKAAAPYTSDHDKPLRPSEERVHEADAYTQYRVEFNGIKGDRVPGYLYVPKRRPDAAKTPLPAILLQYGIGGNKNTNYIVAIGKQFAARGYVVLTIDSPNVGERKTPGKRTLGVLALMGGEPIMHTCSDYSRAIDYLVARPEVDRERVGFVGISWGAITGITYVAYDPRIKAMASMVGGGNFFGDFTPEAAAKAAREGSRSTDPVYHVARIAPRPLLFINVTKDQLILKPWAESLHRAAGPSAKVTWLETDHYFRSLDRGKVCESVIDFMDRELPAKSSEK
jgi:dienelactone hydrolase